MIDKINNENMADYIDKTSNQQAEKEVSNNSRKGDSIQVNYADLADQAVQISETDSTKAVQNAKKLLASGELDSPELFQAAAEKIIYFGI